jgi:hypothetical protein
MKIDSTLYIKNQKKFLQKIKKSKRRFILFSTLIKNHRWLLTFDFCPKFFFYFFHILHPKTFYRWKPDFYKKIRRSAVCQLLNSVIREIIFIPFNLETSPGSFTSSETKVRLILSLKIIKNSKTTWNQIVFILIDW